jgi:hypothetical protein
VGERRLAGTSRDGGSGMIPGAQDIAGALWLALGLLLVSLLAEAM